MPSRYIVIVKIDNKIPIAQFGNDDGNPANAGMDILNFLKNNSMTQFKRMVRGVEQYPEDRAVHMRRYRTPEYKLGLDVLEGVISGQLTQVVSDLAFTRSAFCDWQYIIDLDTDTFMVNDKSAKWSLKELPTMDDFLYTCGDSY